MKKIFIFGFLFAFLMTAFTVDLEAQYSRKRKKTKKKTTTQKNSEYFDESGQSLVDKLWFGADASINFLGAGGQSDFFWGISPMVGYKFTENFSAGPRISFLNVISKVDSGTSIGDLTANRLNYGGGVWTRHKILGTYFVHAEYEILNEEFVFVNPGGTININGDGDIETFRQANSHYYLGGGYGADNGALGFSATILWDFSQEFSSNNIPIVTRFGVTYRF